MNVKKMTNTMLKENVNAFQQVLYQCAKAKPKRKFHALYDKIYRPDNLKTTTKLLSNDIHVKKMAFLNRLVFK